jgi:hypothetical protein
MIWLFPYNTQHLLQRSFSIMLARGMDLLHQNQDRKAVKEVGTIKEP